MTRLNETLKSLLNSNLFIVLMIVLLSTNVLASGGGTGMPYEDWIQTIRDSLTGPVASGIAVVALVGSGVGLIFGGSEMNQFLKTFLYIALVISFILTGNKIIDMFAGSSALLNI